MPAAYSPDTPQVDQSIGAHPSHTGQGSRFNELNSRSGLTPVGANVTEALAEYKKGTFTLEDLKQLAFAMGVQIVEGKDVPALAAKITDLEAKNGALQHRAISAEAAFAKRENLNPDSLREIAATMGWQLVSSEDIAGLKTRAEAAETALAASKSEEPQV